MMDALRFHTFMYLCSDSLSLSISQGGMRRAVRPERSSSQNACLFASQRKPARVIIVCRASWGISRRRCRPGALGDEFEGNDEDLSHTREGVSERGALYWAYSLTSSSLFVLLGVAYAGATVIALCSALMSGTVMNWN